MHHSRRRALLRGLATSATLGAASRTAASPGTDATEPVSAEARARPGHRLRFPRDHGAHPAFRIEWWYITGWLDTASGPLGYQITFFRARTPYTEADPGRFAPRQLLMAHAALADPAVGRLLHEQQAWRVGRLARVASDDTRIALPGWSLTRNAADRYEALVETPALAFALEFESREPPVLQGDAGYSRKGPDDAQASYYYSRPALRARGTVRTGARTRKASGSGWLDHEWSSALLPDGAVGWDWTGIALDDGASLVAFRLRTSAGTAVHAYGRVRSRDGITRDAVPHFEPRRWWTSPRTGIAWPVQWRLVMNERTVLLAPLFDDQELDARASTGTIYWEGAVRATDPGGRPLGRGYLELTGYGDPLETGPAPPATD